MDNKMLSEALISMLGNGNVRIGEPMKSHTTFRIGGAADYYVTPQTEKQIADVITFLKKSDIAYIVIGNGSNILVSDEGFRGVVVELGDAFSGFEILEGSQEDSDDVFVKANAGMKLTRLGNQLASDGIAGFEFATGIPGCIGGAVRMNAGAYGGELKDIIVSAKVIDDEGAIRELSADELELGYRTSIVAKSNMIILEAILRLRKGQPDTIRKNISELAAKRREKQPLEYPSAGSTFKRPEGYFAAKLIEDAGLKGCARGGAQVSEKHAGFVVNKGGATAKDVCELTDYIKSTVMEKFGVKLELEVVKIGF
ncbi:MAG: UDP-N-acetylmuramate dehydrogenase [Eubacteriales bacterium]|nr:UDP-N-acetylmuramate dehydrogenase [Eubacteriales bacterium]